MVDTTESSNTGWIILTVLLVVGLLVFLFLWVSTGITAQPCGQTGTFFGVFGVTAGVDANPLVTCGTNGSTPCIYTFNNLGDCITQCDVLASRCPAFSFDPTTSVMKIVNLNTTYVSPLVDLYVRQPLL